MLNNLKNKGIRSLSRNILEDTLSKILVLPNRLVIPMVPDFDVNDLNGIQSIKPKVFLNLELIG